MNDVVRKRVLQACYSFLVPVARFLLRSGISFREFSELGRVAFVDVATADYGLRGRPTNVSRISAMTGIPRKDVTRVRRLIQEYDTDLKIKLSPLSDVLHHWHTDSNYLDKNGRPKQLSFNGSKDSFELLVRECAGDLPAGAIKVELLRCGAIVTDDKGMLNAVRREVVPQDFDEKLITSLSFNLRGLAETIAFNSNPDRRGDGRIERYVQSVSLDNANRLIVRRLVRKRIIEFTEELDDMFSSQQEVTEGQSRRVGVGVYFFEDSD